MIVEGTHRHVSVDERRARLAVRHRLAPAMAAGDASTVIRALGGALHATDPATAHISTLLRLREPDRASLEHALLTDRSVVRHHAMRRTIWILDRDLVGAAHEACTRALAAKEWARFAKMLAANGVAEPDAWLRDARVRVLDLVDDLGGCTARQLGLAAPDLNVPLALSVGKPYAGTQGAHTRLMQNLGFDGSIVRTTVTGSWVGGEFRWAASEDWIPGGFVGTQPIDTAAAALAAAYLQAFGPATAADVQWWAGWTVTTTRRALADIGAVPVSVDGGDGPGTAWLMPDDVEVVAPVDPWATVLPSLDPSVMGWKERSWYAGDHGRFGHTVFDRNGNAGNSILADGEIIGTWAHRSDRSVAVRFFDRPSKACRSAVDETIDRYLLGVGETVVRPRYPAPLHGELLAEEGDSG